MMQKITLNEALYPRDLVNRIRDVMIEYGLTQRKLADIIGCQQSNISAVLNGKRAVPEVYLLQLSKELNISFDWLKTGDGTMHDTNSPEHCAYPKKLRGYSKEEISNNDSSLAQLKQNTRPRIPVTVTAGTLSELIERATDNDFEQIPVVHQLPSYDFTMVIKGDSMEPVYQSGDEVACKRIDEKRFVQWGKPHILDTSQGIILKRVYEEANHIRCVSYNKEYPDIMIPKEDIRNMFLVVGSIRITEM